MKKKKFSIVCCMLVVALVSCSTAQILAVVSDAAIAGNVVVQLVPHFTAAQKTGFANAISSFKTQIHAVSCPGLTKLALANCVATTLTPAFQSLVTAAGALGFAASDQATIDGVLVAIQTVIADWYVNQGAPAPAPVVVATTSNPEEREAYRSTIRVAIMEEQERGAPASVIRMMSDELDSW